MGALESLQKLMSVNESIAVRYRIDAKESRFVVQAEASGLLSMFGHNPVIAVCGFGGDARFNRDDPQQSSLLMLVQADSLSVVGEVSEKDRLEIERVMRREVLETSHCPEIVFMSKSIHTSRTAESGYSAKLTGSLSLHGVTRDQVIAAQLTAGGYRLRAQRPATR